jgi:RsiW-degrading membrane proteinase PrsW (M82 family)
LPPGIPITTVIFPLITPIIALSENTKNNSKKLLINTVFSGIIFIMLMILFPNWLKTIYPPPPPQNIYVALFIFLGDDFGKIGLISSLLAGSFKC